MKNRMQMVNGELFFLFQRGGSGSLPKRGASVSGCECNSDEVALGRLRCATAAPVLLRHQRACCDFWILSANIKVLACWIEYVISRAPAASCRGRSANPAGLLSKEFQPLQIDDPCCTRSSSRRLPFQPGFQTGLINSGFSSAYAALDRYRCSIVPSAIQPEASTGRDCAAAGSSSILSKRATASSSTTLCEQLASPRKPAFLARRIPRPIRTSKRCACDAHTPKFAAAIRMTCKLHCRRRPFRKRSGHFPSCITPPALAASPDNVNTGRAIALTPARVASCRARDWSPASETATIPALPSRLSAALFPGEPLVRAPIERVALSGLVLSTTGHRGAVRLRIGFLQEQRGQHPPPRCAPVAMFWYRRRLGCAGSR